MLWPEHVIRAFTSKFGGGNVVTGLAPSIWSHAWNRQAFDARQRRIRLQPQKYNAQKCEGSSWRVLPKAPAHDQPWAGTTSGDCPENNLQLDTRLESLQSSWADSCTTLIKQAKALVPPGPSIHTEGDELGAMVEEGPSSSSPCHRLCSMTFTSHSRCMSTKWSLNKSLHVAMFQKWRRCLVKTSDVSHQATTLSPWHSSFRWKMLLHKLQERKHLVLAECQHQNEKQQWLEKIVRLICSILLWPLCSTCGPNNGQCSGAFPGGSTCGT